MRIDACLDSHVHWPATGEFAQRLRLDGLRAPEEILTLKPEAQHRRGEWLIGFGWDDNLWDSPPSLGLLDRWNTAEPVCLSRCDAHAVWVNSEALRRAGITKGSVPQVAGGRIEVDANGEPTGLLVDKAADLIKMLIPRAAGFEVRRQLLKATKIFNDAGFTHIRDMTCDETQWNEAYRLDESGLLTLAVEEYFSLNSVADLEKVISNLKSARASQSPNLRAKGVKIFLDGALGSEGAWLSKCYCGRDHAGLQLWQAGEVQEVMLRAWREDFDVAAHAIGDAAVDWIVSLTSKLKAAGEKVGPLHIEHGEIIRGDTVERMRGLDIEVHIQPCHWLSDQRWLEKKVGELINHAFPWRRLQEAEIPFDFGSDAPIEPASVARTFQAIRQSAGAGIPRLLGQPSSYMSHRDLSWAPNSFTLFEEEAPAQVVFRGEHLG